MFNLYETLDRMREKPAMYLGKKSITNLDLFLCGCFYVAGAAAREQGEPKFYLFHDWVAHKYNWFESTAGWRNIILQECGWNEAKALDTFYELLDEFRASEGKMPERPKRPTQRYKEPPK